MIHARSSLFFKTYTLSWLCVTISFAAAIVGNPNSTVTDIWRDNEAVIHMLFVVLCSLASLLGTACAALLGIELAVRRGWEPHFLEVYRPACEILEQERLPNGKSNVTVKMQDGSIDAYEADEQETGEIIVGSVSHLWVIGAYISRIQVVSKSEGIYVPSSGRRMKLKPNSKPVLATVTIIVSTLLASYLTAYGLVVAIGGSMIVPWEIDETTRMASVYMGGDINFIGLVLILAGLALFGGIWYLWATGWDETTFQTESTGQNWD